MSNYKEMAIHPKTGEPEMADWLDDYYGRHRYGVWFPSDGEVYPEAECRVAARLPTKLLSKELRSARNKKIVDAYNRGDKVSAILAEFGVSKDTLKRAMREFSATPRPSGRPRGDQYKARKKMLIHRELRRMMKKGSVDY